MRNLSLVLILLASGVATAQTRPLPMPQFVEPPHLNGADAALFPNGILYNPTLGCLAGAVAGQWPCLATDADVTAAQAAAVQQSGASAAAIYLPRSEAAATTATLNSRIDAVQAQAVSRRSCANFTVATGFTVPTLGVSTVINVPLAGVPVGTSCDAGSASRMALGARPDPIVQVAGTVSMAFVGNSGILSQAVAIPSGTYRVCCDL